MFIPRGHLKIAVNECQIWMWGNKLTKTIDAESQKHTHTYLAQNFDQVLYWAKARIFRSVQLLSYVRLFVTQWMQHTRPPCPSPAPGVCSNSCPLSR